VIRLEAHKFWKYWGINHPKLFDAHFRFGQAGAMHKGHAYRISPAASWNAYHEQGQAGEWQAYNTAADLDAHAAAMSISMGLPQIMGFNHDMIGYSSPESMLQSFKSSENFQLIGFFDFIKGPESEGRPPLKALKRGKLDDFIKFYNGPGDVDAYSARIESILSAFRELKPMI
jgi:hypothetical protein